MIAVKSLDASLHSSLNFHQISHTVQPHYRMAVLSWQHFARITAQEQSLRAIIKCGSATAWKCTAVQR